MATITKRQRAGGGIAYRAVIRLKRDGVLYHRESKTFGKKVFAETWAQKREVELRENGPEVVRTNHMTIGDIVLAYRDTLINPIRPLHHSKNSCLERVARYFANMPAMRLTPSDIIQFCKDRAAEGAGPATVEQDIVYLRLALQEGNEVLGYACPYEVVSKPRRMLKSMGLIAPSRKRTRRLEGDEYERLLDYFRWRDAAHNVEIPMASVFPFAVASCMRQAEITRIRWNDIDEAKRTIIIRHRKDPAHNERNDIVPLLGESWDIVQRQPEICERIFPFESQSIRARFARATKALGISGLTFHDLRREGATRLLEAGYSIAEVIKVTGHRDWNQFARYVGLRAEDIHRPSS